MKMETFVKSFCDAFNGEAHEFYLDKDAFLVGQAALAEVAILD